MEYQEIKDIKTLYLIRQDWFNGEYFLTNNISNYGKLIYEGFARRTGVVFIAGNGWTFESEEPLFYGKTEVSIKDNNNNLVGKAVTEHLDTYPYLIMKNGFKAKFVSISMFSNQYEWFSEKWGTIIRIKSPFFSLTDTITLFENNIPDDLIPMLCFLSEHILISMRRRRSTF